jgi:prophage antirepressor-like protein
MTSLALSFNDVNFTPVEQNGQAYLTSSELATALGYADTRSVTKIYNRYADEFTSNMTKIIETTEVVNLSTSNLIRKVRIFSLRGCHLIAMFSKTAIAKQFRKWVLDILDKEVGQPVAKTHKSEREPLTNAVNLLVAKTKHLNYSEAYKLVHQRFNIKSIDEIPYEAIPVAVEYVHHLIALYSSTGKQVGLFDKDTYELIRKLTEAILSQNGMMNDVWKALELIAPDGISYYAQYITASNVLARKVSIELDFKTRQGVPLIDGYCKTINFSAGCRMGVNPKWFNAPAW